MTKILKKDTSTCTSTLLFLLLLEQTCKGNKLNHLTIYATCNINGNSQWLRGHLVQKYHQVFQNSSADFDVH